MNEREKVARGLLMARGNAAVVFDPVLAKDEKARLGDTLPLPPDLAELLRGWLPSLESDAKP